MTWYEALSTDAVAPGKIGKCFINDQKVAIYNVDGEFFATENRCSHEEVLLSGGYMHGKEVECPLHGARFDVTTGAVKALPAAVPIKTYKTKVEHGKVFVEL